MRNQFCGIEDDLFTEDGFAIMQTDALERMVNPYLRDPIDRVTRDPKRKLGWDDRLIGSIRYAIDAELIPQDVLCGVKGLSELMEADGFETPKVALD